MPALFKRLGLVILVTAFLPLIIFADQISDLQQAIQNKQGEIDQLTAEITTYQTDLNQAGERATSLNQEIKLIDLTRRKLAADIALTEKQISAITFRLQELALEINDKSAAITKVQLSLGKLLRQLNQAAAQNLSEQLLAVRTFGEEWQALASLLQFNKKLAERLASLRALKAEFEDKQTATVKAQTKLVVLKTQLADQKKIADQVRQNKDQLLAQTKNRESAYRLLLADRLKKKQQVEVEVRAIEEQIKVILDPSRLPRTGLGILKWPLDQVTITQYFGNTEFATKNPQIYNGAGHNGIDLRAPIGTPVKAAESGRVLGIGDTDLACAGASYGKWVLIDHANGLTTLYAHLSLIKVGEGQTIGLREIIGYSGATGYATGPHLHFVVFASQAVKIGELKSRVPGCGIYRLPLSQSGFGGYLNPLSYL